MLSTSFHIETHYQRLHQTRTDGMLFYLHVFELWQQDCDYLSAAAARLSAVMITYA